MPLRNYSLTHHPVFLSHYSPGAERSFWTWALQGSHFWHQTVRYYDSCTICKQHTWHFVLRASHAVGSKVSFSVACTNQSSCTAPILASRSCISLAFSCTLHRQVSWSCTLGFLTQNGHNLINADSDVLRPGFAETNLLCKFLMLSNRYLFCFLSFDFVTVSFFPDTFC